MGVHGNPTPTWGEIPVEVIVPMEPVSASQIPEGPQWVTQIKWDGVRVLTYAPDPATVRLINRHGRERTIQYPELRDVRSYCTSTPVILDGEVIAFGPNGTPDFHEVMRRDRAQRVDRIPRLVQSVPIAYMVFDILYWKDDWIVSWPFWKRYELLKNVLSSHPTVHCVESNAEGKGLLLAMREQSMEGVVAKQLDSPYRIGQKHSDWRKVKIYHDAIMVIGGFTANEAGTPNALLLGLYDESGELGFAGQAGPGKLTATEWSRLIQQLRSRATPSCPFSPVHRIRRATWTLPNLTVKISFREWTRERLLWQPTVQALTTTEASACTWERSGTSWL